MSVQLPVLQSLKENAPPQKPVSKLSSSKDPVLEKQLQFENSVSNPNLEPSALLQAWHVYLKFLDKNPSKLEPMEGILKRCLLSFNTENFNNDERYIKCWIRYAECKEMPYIIFESMSDLGIGLNSHLLYEGWAITLEQEKKYEEAEAVLKRGLEKIPNSQHLRKSLESFQKRMKRRNVQKQTISSRPALAPLKEISSTKLESSSSNQNSKNLPKPNTNTVMAPVEEEDLTFSDIFTKMAKAAGPKTSSPTISLTTKKLVEEMFGEEPVADEDEEDEDLNPMLMSKAPRPSEVFDFSVFDDEVVEKPKSKNQNDALVFELKEEEANLGLLGKLLHDLRGKNPPKTSCLDSYFEEMTISGNTTTGSLKTVLELEGKKYEITDEVGNHLFLATSLETWSLNSSCLLKYQASLQECQLLESIQTRTNEKDRFPVVKEFFLYDSKTFMFLKSGLMTKATPMDDVLMTALPESLVLYLALELLKLLRVLQSMRIIHGNLACNSLVFSYASHSPVDWSADCPGVWAQRGFRLVNFDTCIDLAKYPKDARFRISTQTSNPFLLQQLSHPLSYHIDLFAACDVIHRMLFQGEPLKVEFLKNNWLPKNSFSQFSSSQLWCTLFSDFLNCQNLTKEQELCTLVQNHIKSFETFLSSNQQLAKNVKLALTQCLLSK